MANAISTLQSDLQMLSQSVKMALSNQENLHSQREAKTQANLERELSKLRSEAAKSDSKIDGLIEELHSVKTTLRDVSTSGKSDAIESNRKVDEWNGVLRELNDSSQRKESKMNALSERLKELESSQKGLQEETSSTRKAHKSHSQTQAAIPSTIHRLEAKVEAIESITTSTKDLRARKDGKLALLTEATRDLEASHRQLQEEFSLTKSSPIDSAQFRAATSSAVLILETKVGVLEASSATSSDTIQKL